MSGRFRAKFSDEQKAAIVRAIVEQGIPASTVVYTARAEGLEGLPPFQMSPSQARELAAKERGRRKLSQLQTPHGAAARAESIIPRAVALVEAEIDRLERQATETKEPLDLGAVRQAVRLAVDIRRWARQVTGGDDAEPEDGKPKAEPGLLERLSTQRAKTESKDAQAQQGHAPAAKSAETDASAGPAPSHA